MSDNVWSINGTMPHTIDQGNTTWILVPTVYGYVWISRRLDDHDPNNDSTELRFIYSGQVYTRYINHWYTNRYCITLAKRFAKEKVKA